MSDLPVDDNQSNSEFIDDSFASDGGIVITVFGCLIFCCFCLGHCRKITDDDDDSTKYVPAHPGALKKWLLGFARHSFMLVEDLIFLYWGIAAGHSDRDIFLIIFPFAMSGVFLMAFTSCWARWIGIAAHLLIEIAQFITFVGMCNWEGKAWGTFGAILVIQAIITGIHVRIVMKEPPLEDDEKLMHGAQMCILIFQVVMSCLGVIPYMYFDSTSPFRQRWFEVMLTCSIWLGRLAIELSFEEFLKLTNIDGGTEDQEETVGSLSTWFFQIVLVSQKVIQYFIFVIVVYYYSIEGWKGQQHRAFEHGWCIFMIVSLSCDVCSTGCKGIQYLMGVQQPGGEEAIGLPQLFNIRQLSTQMQMQPTQ